MRKRLLILASASSLIAGCTSMHETPTIINSRGVVPRPDVTPVEGQGGYQGDLYRRFYESAQDISKEGDEVDAGQFLQSGFALIYADCDNFFRDMGGTQRSGRAVRDMITPVVSLITGIVSLGGSVSPGEQRVLSALALWSSASNAGFDIYERHYLFNAENIDSVRELILKALTTHSATVFNDPPTTFEDAAVQLIDNQTICTPPHIRRLVREAIRKGEIEATVTGSAATQQDFEVRRSLGQLLSPPNPLSDAQTFILWQLFIDPRPDADKLKDFYPVLASLGDRNPLLETTNAAGTKAYSYRPGWTHEGAVVERLLHLPVETLARYQGSFRAAEAQGQAQARAPGTFAAPAQPRPVTIRRTRRVGVSVR